MPCTCLGSAADEQFNPMRCRGVDGVCASGCGAGEPKMYFFALEICDVKAAIAAGSQALNRLHHAAGHCTVWPCWRRRGDPPGVHRWCAYASPRALIYRFHGRAVRQGNCACPYVRVFRHCSHAQTAVVSPPITRHRTPFVSTLELLITPSAPPFTACRFPAARDGVPGRNSIGLPSLLSKGW